MKRLVGIVLCALLLLAGSQAGCARNSAASKAVVRTYTDGQGHTVTLQIGRGNGHRGDWGWLHIRNKHVRGIWYDGGTVTTFPQAFSISSDAEVQNLIGQALQQPPRQEHGRGLFRYRVPGSRYQLLVVVSSDGTIITAYPQH